MTDADNPTGAITGPVSYFWQSEKRLDDGVFEDIVIATGLGDVRATGTTFTPGRCRGRALALRVGRIYQDANGVLETVFSAPTAAVANVNDAPGGSLTISDTTPTETQQLERDPSDHRYRWSRLAPCSPTSGSRRTLQWAVVAPASISLETFQAQLVAFTPTGSGRPPSCEWW